MMQSYDDILDTMTRLVREVHWFHYLHMEEGHEGAHPDCKTFSYDVLGKPDAITPDGKRCCTCVAVPNWWDENGTPRFMEHHPRLCPDIYADEVALLEIACQACERRFKVQMSWGRSSELVQRARAWKLVEGSIREKLGVRDARIKIPIPSWDVTSGLAGEIRNGTLHYGDPPAHGADCTTGVTMNVWDLRVLEFWKRGKGAHDWVRVAELEADLPDARDPERLTGVPHQPCPQCKALVPDHDGFGVVAHLGLGGCGYCKHASITDGVCGFCGERRPQ